MGYDMELVSLKKKKFKEIQGIIDGYTYKDMFTDFLFVSHNDSGDIAQEYGTWILSENRNLFQDLFHENGIKIDCNDAVIVEPALFEKMKDWLKNKLESIKLIDLIESDVDLYESEILISAYKSMVSAEVDFEHEILVFEHDW